jgi:hypothetical protein
MLADTPVARATSIPISDFDETADDIVQMMAQIKLPDPMVNVFVAGSKASPAVAAPPAEAHPLMALGQSAYRRNQFDTPPAGCMRAIATVSVFRNVSPDC